jgi:hypothetical protein
MWMTSGLASSAAASETTSFKLQAASCKRKTQRQAASGKPQATSHKLQASSFKHKHSTLNPKVKMDSRLRGNDGVGKAISSKLQAAS